jgi:hypothetical protein
MGKAGPPGPPRAQNGTFLCRRPLVVRALRVDRFSPSNSLFVLSINSKHLDCVRYLPSVSPRISGSAHFRVRSPELRSEADTWRGDRETCPVENCALHEFSLM